ncbi:MAG: M28 family peptidase [Vicinamibacterales bacterium]
MLDRCRHRSSALALTALLVTFPSASHAQNRPGSIGALQPPASAPRTSVIDADRLIDDLRALSSPALEGRLTGSAGNKRAQALILDRFKQLGLRPVNGSYEQAFAFKSAGRGGERAFPDATNIMGMAAGTSAADTFIIVSAHYDHLGVRDGRTYHGADDNASGVAALLAIAGWFAQHPPRTSVLLVAFDAEEQGLQGAKHFVARPPVDLGRVKAIVNMDMIGRGDKGTLFVAGTSQNPSLKPLVAEAAARRTLTLAFGHDKPASQASGLDDWTNSSDHGPFNAAGIPFLYFGVEDHPDYHKPTDTADKIPRAFYVEAVRVVLDTVRRLSDDASR